MNNFNHLTKLTLNIKMHTKSIGQIGEDLVLKEYARQGWQLVTRNFQFYQNGQKGRLGEIDLVVTKDNCLVFVEVKTRFNQTLGHPLEQIDLKQMKTLYQTYTFFLVQNPIYQEYIIRFDLALVSKQKIQILKNAYDFSSFADL